MADAGSEQASHHTLSKTEDGDEFDHLNIQLTSQDADRLDQLERGQYSEQENPPRSPSPIQVGRYALRGQPSPSKNCTDETLNLIRMRQQRSEQTSPTPGEVRGSAPLPLLQMEPLHSKESTPAPLLGIHQMPSTRDSTPVPLYRASKERTPGPHPNLINGPGQNLMPVGPLAAPFAAAYVQGGAPPGVVPSLQQPWRYGFQHSEYLPPHGLPGYFVPPHHPSLYLPVRPQSNGDPSTHPSLYAAPVSTNPPAYPQNAAAPVAVKAPIASQSATVKPTDRDAVQPNKLDAAQLEPITAQAAAVSQKSSEPLANEELDLEDDGDEIWDEEGTPEEELFEAKGSAGRPSKELMEMFDATVARIHSEINTLAEKMGRSPLALKRTILGRVRGSNSWTYYARYFKANQKEELSRLPPDTSYDLTTPQGHCQVRKKCYEKFKDDKGPNYAKFLKVWAETEALSEADSTPAERGRLFRKRAADGQRLVSQSELEGFHGVFVLVGESVRHDRSHRVLHASPAFHLFFENHFLGNADEFLDHLQSWAYAGVSKIVMNANARARLEVLEAKVQPVVVQASVGKKDIKSESLPLAVMAVEDDEDLGAELRRCLGAAATCVELNLNTRGKKFPWLSLLTICAENGFKLINYPDEVEAPHIKPKGKKSKGIDNLPKAHKLALLSQLKDTNKPLSFAKTAPEDVLDGKAVVLIFLSGKRIFEATKPTKGKKDRGKALKSVSFIEESDNAEEPDAEYSDSNLSADDETVELATPLARRSHPRQAKTTAADILEQLPSKVESGIEVTGSGAETGVAVGRVNGKGARKRPATPTKQSPTHKRRRDSPPNTTEPSEPSSPCNKDLSVVSTESAARIPNHPTGLISNIMAPDAPIPSNPQSGSDTPTANSYNISDRSTGAVNSGLVPSSSETANSYMQNGGAGYAIPQEDQVLAALRLLGLSGFSPANLHQLGIANAQQLVQQPGGPHYPPNGIYAAPNGGPAYPSNLNPQAPNIPTPLYSSNTVGLSYSAAPYSTSSNPPGMHGTAMAPPQQNGGYPYPHGQAMYPGVGNASSGGQAMYPGVGNASSGGFGSNAPPQ